MFELTNDSTLCISVILIFGDLFTHIQYNLSGLGKKISGRSCAIKKIQRNKKQALWVCK